MHGGESKDQFWQELKRLNVVDVIARFKTHAWPGNLGELEEAVRRLVVGGGGDRLD